MVFEACQVRLAFSSSFSSFPVFASQLSQFLFSLTAVSAAFILTVVSPICSLRDQLVCLSLVYEQSGATILLATQNDKQTFFHCHFLDFVCSSKLASCRGINCSAFRGLNWVKMSRTDVTLIIIIIITITIAKRSSSM